MNEAAITVTIPHRTWWKVAINTVLRAVQPQRRKFVIYSVIETDASDKANVSMHVVGYGFGRIPHAKAAA